jgi:hypothetical protein
MARLSDRANVLPRANSLPHEDSHRLSSSEPLPRTPEEKQDQGRNAVDAAVIAESRRVERPASEGPLAHKSGSNGGVTGDINAGVKPFIALASEGISSGDARAAKQSGATEKRPPTKRAPSADVNSAEAAKEKLVVSGAMPTVPRGYYIVERVKMHKTEEVCLLRTDFFIAPFVYTCQLLGRAPIPHKVGRILGI